jgi:hypothetical protein
MGYPMTWKRLISRNRLSAGDYSNPGEHKANVNLIFNDKLITEKTFYEELGPYYVLQIQQYEREFSSLLGDLRRLEHDMLDEKELCRRISEMTGADMDTVATILQAFASL